MTNFSGTVSLSTHVRDKERQHPIWELRYRLPSGKQSDKSLGKAWLKQSRAPEGFLSRPQAEALAQEFLAEQANSAPEDRKSFGAACQAFLDKSKRERALRGSTHYEYARITKRLCERPWRSQTWGERPLDSFTKDELLDLRRQLLDAGRKAGTINQYRRVIRGVFGKRSAVAEVWEWVAVKQDSAGKLHFYEPSQVSQLKEHAADDRDRAIYTLATEAGPRMSEILAVKVRNVDFETGLLRFEDGYTQHGGHAGTKGHRVRSVPMTSNVRSALLPFCQGKTADQLVFEDLGLPLSSYGLYRRFKSTAKRASLPEIRFHDLRHTFGTQAIRKVDIYTLQRLMGHQSITTTQIYLHYQPDPDLGSTLSALWESDQPAEVVPIRKAG